ncbi:RES family NAD+ phosphorylase [Alloacidobacterium dinghuense]|uniref:RES family NAD+ phosphorylase n=2 Tax=Alloacidobacterium dinghuense TaxID=2763107 RepID=A0A7G8BQL6_9BACT|nr:RES family NAD+ phosphorylase [Alloacidobacterium dinghuense]
MEAHPELPIPEDPKATAGLPPVTQLRRFDTHRLLPAKYSVNYDSVLTRIAENDEHLREIFELDNATNARLEAEENLRPGISQRELVFNVPCYRIVNAAFTHPNPLGARFSTNQRGAWYAAFELATAKAEVMFHKSVEFAEINWSEREEMQYDEYLADFTGSFHDLRTEAQPGEKQGKFSDCLDPASYVASQELAVELLDHGSLGVIYPSVRRPGGTCIACFRPSVVANVRKGSRFRMSWTPNRIVFTKEGL